MEKKAASELPRVSEAQEKMAAAKKVQDELNSIFHTTFSTPAGKQILNYLRNTTINTIQGPDIKPETLFYQEGRRSVVAEIVARMTAAENKHG